MALGGLAKRIFLWFSGAGGPVIVYPPPVGVLTVTETSHRGVTGPITRSVTATTRRSVTESTLLRSVTAQTRREVQA